MAAEVTAAAVSVEAVMAEESVGAKMEAVMAEERMEAKVVEVDMEIGT